MIVIHLTEVSLISLLKYKRIFQRGKISSLMTLIISSHLEIMTRMQAEAPNSNNSKKQCNSSQSFLEMMETEIVINYSHKMTRTVLTTIIMHLTNPFYKKENQWVTL